MTEGLTVWEREILQEIHYYERQLHQAKHRLEMLRINRNETAADQENNGGGRA